jgi:hypothetical protein
MTLPIVERLRDQNRFLVGKLAHDTLGRLCLEAADTIEQLYEALGPLGRKEVPTKPQGNAFVLLIPPCRDSCCSIRARQSKR